MKKLLLTLLFLLPLAACAQVKDWDVTQEGYYRVVVNADTLSSRFNRFDTALKFAYDQADSTNKIIRIVQPDYRFGYTLQDPTPPDTVFVGDSLSFDRAGIRNIDWQQSNDPDSDQYYLTTTFDSGADSVLIHYTGADSTGNIDRRHTVTNQADSALFRGQSLVRVTLTAYYRGWSSSTVFQTPIFKKKVMALEPGYKLDLSMKAGTTIVADELTQWTSNGHTFAIPSEQSSPATNVETLDGTAVASFDGISDMMELVDASYDLKPADPTFDTKQLLIKLPTGGDFEYIIDGQDGINKGAIYYNSTSIISRTGGTEAVSSTKPENQWFVLTVVIDGQNDNVDIWIDKTKVVTAGAGFVYSGTGLTLGSRAGGWGTGKFDLAEVVHYIDTTAKMSDETIKSNIDYILNKWRLGGGGATALSGNIPVTVTLTADLDEDAALSGNVLAQSLLGGDISEEAALAGGLTVQTSLAGALNAIEALSGNVPISVILSGDLTSGAFQLLSGDVGISTQLAGELVKEAALKGDVSVSVMAAGDLAEAAALSGDITVTTGLSGELQEIADLKGNVLIVTSLSGELSSQGRAWAGTISVSHQPLYTIDVKHQPLYTIEVNHNNKKIH